MELKYGNPLIWHMILDDIGFNKICENYDHYINQEPIFVKDDAIHGRYLKHHSISPTYPIMLLDDVKIHFIHHHTEKEVYEKFCRRRDRSSGKTVLSVIWDFEVKNKKVLQKLKSLPNCIVATGVKTQVDAAKQIIQKLNG